MEVHPDVTEPTIVTIELPQKPEAIELLPLEREAIDTEKMVVEAMAAEHGKMRAELGNMRAEHEKMSREWNPIKSAVQAYRNELKVTCSQSGLTVQASLMFRYAGLHVNSMAFYSSRRDLSKQQNTFKSKTIFYHKKTRLKPERATRPIPEKKKASKANPEKKKASVRESYKADPEKKASVRNSYKADPKKKASVHDSYNADIQSKQSAKRQEDIEENRAVKRQKYEDNSAAIKASERNQYWNDPAV
ncbi:hypothetical protein EMCRGX_G003786 [Ephydatia muelleri]